MGIRLKASTIKNMMGQTDLFQKIAQELGRENIETVRRWIRANEVNGPLTTLASLRLISDSLGIPADLLTEETNGTINPRVSDRHPSVERHDSETGEQLPGEINPHGSDTN